MRVLWFAVFSAIVPNDRTLMRVFRGHWLRKIVCTHPLPGGDAGRMEPLLPIGAQSGHDGLPGPSERGD